LAQIPAPLAKAAPLKALLVSRGLTQKDFARRIGVNPITLNRCLNGMQPPSTTMAAAAAKAIGLAETECWWPDRQPQALRARRRKAGQR
jgi:transcriptional regulator with XRE-family HTH domain